MSNSASSVWKKHTKKLKNEGAKKCALMGASSSIPSIILKCLCIKIQAPLSFFYLLITQ